jgi:predicted nucleic acid-binding protein
VTSRDVFVDTWGWVALGNRRDPSHQEAKRCYLGFRAKKARVYTSDYVLDETITLLFKRTSYADAAKFISDLLKGAERDTLTIERITSVRFAEAMKLRFRFQDKPRISFTDFTTIAVMHELGIRQILTEDDHFMQTGMGFQKIPSNKGH